MFRNEGLMGSALGDTHFFSLPFPSKMVILKLQRAPNPLEGLVKHRLRGPTNPMRQN